MNILLLGVTAMVWIWGWCICKYLHDIRELLSNLEYLKRPSTYCEFDGTKREANGVCIECLTGLSKGMAEYYAKKETNP